MEWTGLWVPEEAFLRDEHPAPLVRAVSPLGCWRPYEADVPASGLGELATVLLTLLSRVWSLLRAWKHRHSSPGLPRFPSAAWFT